MGEQSAPKGAKRSEGIQTLRQSATRERSTKRIALYQSAPGALERSDRSAPENIERSDKSGALRGERSGGIGALRFGGKRTFEVTHGIQSDVMIPTI